MKLKKSYLIPFSILAILILLEGKNLWINGSLILADINHSMQWYRGELSWVNRYNEAIWLSKSGHYSEAKALLSPLLNESLIPKRAEIAELYGDLIYLASGSIDDTIRMYERSLSITPNTRLQDKIRIIQQLREQSSGSGSIDTALQATGSTQSGSLLVEVKKKEISESATKRSEFLGNETLSRQESQSTLERLIESAKGETVEVVKDW